MSCANYAPDAMAGGSDCRNCGWPQEDHEPQPFYKRLTPEQAEYLKGEPVKDEPRIVFHASSDPDACKHEWGGWREFDGGRSGEQVCKLCGMGAMAHSLRTGP